MRLIRNFILIALCILTFQALQAQRYGHVNSAQLIESHPNVATANAELEAFRKSVSDPFEAKTKTFQSKYEFFMQEMNAGPMLDIISM